MKKSYLSSRMIQIGLSLIIFGWGGPLLMIIMLDAVGLWPDPNPNPIGPGLLFFVTSCPAIICLVVGFAQTRRKS